MSPLSPNAFGSFVENLNNVIYDTLWANALRNPQLERTGPQQPVAPSPCCMAASKRAGAWSLWTRCITRSSFTRWPIPRSRLKPTGPGRAMMCPVAASCPLCLTVDVFSALTADSSKIVAFLVNRQQSDARPVHLSVAGFTAASRSATILTSTDPQDGNGWDHPDSVKPIPFALPAPDKSGSLDFTLPPHSLVVLTLSRR